MSGGRRVARAVADPRNEVRMSVCIARIARIPSFALLLATLIPLAAVAQTVDVEAVEPEPSEQRWVTHAGYGHMFSTDINSNGSVSTDSFQAGLGARFDLTDSLSLAPRFLYSLDAYDMTREAQPFAWGNIHQYTLLGVLNWKIDDSWSLLGGPILRISGEGSSAFDDSFTGGALLGFNYRVNPDLSIGAAIGVMSQIEDDPGLIPLPLLRWRFVEDWTLRFGISQLGGRNGVGPELSWAISEVVDLGVGVQYQRRRYRLDDHGSNSGHIGEERSFPLYARIGFHPQKDLTLEVFGGVVAGGELKTQDVGGDNTFDRGYDATPTLGLRAEYRF
jgi:hypothetical protein